jgi:hypothetical protein
MAETPTTYKFDVATFEKNVTAIKEHQMTFQGKRNHNPFLWMHKNLLPLEERFKKGERTLELFTGVANLLAKKEAPILDPNYVEVKEEPVKAVIGGIKLPPAKQ